MNSTRLLSFQEVQMARTEIAQLQESVESSNKHCNELEDKLNISG